MATISDTLELVIKAQDQATNVFQTIDKLLSRQLEILEALRQKEMVLKMRDEATPKMNVFMRLLTFLPRLLDKVITKLDIMVTRAAIFNLKILATMGVLAAFAMKYTENIRQLTVATGESQETIAKWLVNLQAAGVSADISSNAVNSLSKHIHEANIRAGESRRLFDALGVSFKDKVTGGARDTWSVLLDIVEVFDTLEKTGKKIPRGLSEATEMIFGSPEMLKILKMTKEELSAIDIKFAKHRQSVLAAEQAWGRLKDQWEKNKVYIENIFVKALEAMELPLRLISNGIDKLSQFLSSLPPWIYKTIVALALFHLALFAVYKIIGWILGLMFPLFLGLIIFKLIKIMGLLPMVISLFKFLGGIVLIALKAMGVLLAKIILIIGIITLGWHVLISLFQLILYLTVSISSKMTQFLDGIKNKMGVFSLWAKLINFIIEKNTSLERIMFKLANNMEKLKPLNWFKKAKKDAEEYGDTIDKVTNDAEKKLLGLFDTIQEDILGKATRDIMNLPDAMGIPALMETMKEAEKMSDKVESSTMGRGMGYFERYGGKSAYGFLRGGTYGAPVYVNLQNVVDPNKVSLLDADRIAESQRLR